MVRRRTHEGEVCQISSVMILNNSKMTKDPTLGMKYGLIVHMLLFSGRSEVPSCPHCRLSLSVSHARQLQALFLRFFEFQLRI